MGDIVGILLAAGSGSRFGGDKLLHLLPDGTPMGVAAARSLRAGLDRVIAVTRPGDDHLAALLCDAGCEVIVAADAVKGMGHSLAAGVRAAPDAAGWLISLGDMPGIAPATHQAVAAALRQGHSLTAATYQGQRGHPVGFAAAWRAELSLLQGDMGARTILAGFPEHLHLLPVGDAGILKDIDRPTDATGVVDPGRPSGCASVDGHFTGQRNPQVVYK